VKRDHVTGSLDSHQEKVMQFEHFLRSSSFALPEGSIDERYGEIPLSNSTRIFFMPRSFTIRLMEGKRNDNQRRP
jgi:hypothetical protein